MSASCTPGASNKLANQRSGLINNCRRPRETSKPISQAVIGDDVRRNTFTMGGSHQHQSRRGQSLACSLIKIGAHVSAQQRLHLCVPLLRCRIRASRRSAHSGSAGCVRSVPGMIRMSPCIDAISGMKWLLARRFRHASCRIRFAHAAKHKFALFHVDILAIKTGIEANFCEHAVEMGIIAPPGTISRRGRQLRSGDYFNFA